MLTDTERQVLTKLLELEGAIDNAPIPAPWPKSLRLEWEFSRAWGPPFSIPKWFGLDGRIPEADRQRYLRATKALESRGLLVLHRGSGGKVERAQITDEGRAALTADEGAK